MLRKHSQYCRHVILDTPESLGRLTFDLGQPAISIGRAGKEGGLVVDKQRHRFFEAIPSV